MEPFILQIYINFQVRNSSKGSAKDGLKFELHDLNPESQISNLIFTANTPEEKIDLVDKINTEIKRIESFRFDLGNPTM